MTKGEPACIACQCAQAHPFAKRNGFPVYSCTACGTLFVYPMPADTNAVYGKDYFAGGGHCGGYTNYDADKRAMAHELKRLLNAIEDVRKKSAGNMLDVGAATGVFLEEARARGWQTHGVEISEYAANTARKKGLDVRTGTLRTYAAPPGSFDLLTLLDVIEHVTDPNETLKAARTLLAPGGILALITPDASSLTARVMGSKWHLLNPPEHLACYSRRGLRMMLDHAGFDIVSMRVPQKSFTLSYICHVLGNRFGLTLLSRFGTLLSTSPLGRLTLPLNARDNMFVIARRI